MHLVFDIGGTNLRVAVSSDGKTLSAIKVVPTPQDFNEGIRTLKQVSDELSRGQKIEKAAGGITGPLDKQKIMSLRPPHQPDWGQKPLKEELEQVLGVPVHLENDTALAALGEALLGTGAGSKIVAYLTISTGVGGARIVGGKIDENSLGFEPGHQIIIPDGQLCDCGGKGHLESYVSGSGIAKIYGKKAEDISDPKVWEEVTSYLAIGLNNTIVHWSPDILVLGGSVMKSISLDKVTSYLKDMLKIFPKIPEVAPAKLAHQSGLWGALQILKSL